MCTGVLVYTVNAKSTPSLSHHPTKQRYTFRDRICTLHNCFVENWKGSKGEHVDEEEAKEVVGRFLTAMVIDGEREPNRKNSCKEQEN